MLPKWTKRALKLMLGLIILFALLVGFSYTEKWINNHIFYTTEVYEGL